MKKLLLIGFVLAILLLAFPQGVMAGTIQTATVSADITTYIELFPLDAPAGWGGLIAGDSTTGHDNYFAADHGDADPLSLKIETNKGWTITASDERSGVPAANEGCMASPTKFLRAPMQIETETSWGSLAGSVVIGDGDSSEIGVKTFTRDLMQKVYSDDTPDEYSITITFTAANV